MASSPNRVEQRPYLFAAFAWCYTCLWVAAFIVLWRYYDSWHLWAKIGASVGLILTTPDASDLFLFLRILRGRGTAK